MEKLIQKVANVAVEGICKVAKANVACATSIIGYQPQVPQALQPEEEGCNE